MSKDTLKVDQFLEQVQSLVSQNGKMILQLQDDGNLVLYERSSTGDKAIWDSKTNNDMWITKGIMQPDGNFVLYNDGKEARWSTKTDGKGDKTSFLKVVDQGNVFIFSGGKEIWRDQLDYYITRYNRLLRVLVSSLVDAVEK